MMECGELEWLCGNPQTNLANENLNIVSKEELNQIIDDVEDAFADVLNALRIDWTNDHNANNTPRRVAKMYVNEIFKGRFVPKPKVTTFPNHKQYDQIYVVGPIEIRSTCCHHFAPITGSAWIAVYPGTRVLGLSKFHRIADWVASRPTIQEEMTEQIATEIENVTEARGVMVVLQCSHGCMSLRGVKAHDSTMMTSVVRGEFLDKPDMKKEALSLMRGLEK